MDKVRKFGVFLCTILLTLSSFVGLVQAEEDSANSVMQPGVYFGEANGHNGIMKVEVEVTEDSIVAISVSDHGETAWIGDIAIERLPQEIIDSQSLDVDIVSGSTLTSYGIISAVTDAISQAGGDVDLFKENGQEEVVSEEVEELTTQVLVIGGGPAGMASSLRADELGYEVILLEKKDFLGGSLAVSGGMQVVRGSDLQAEFGVEDDSVEEMVQDFMDNGDNLNNIELVTLYAENVGETVNWLSDYVGIEYNMDVGLSYAAEYRNDRLLTFEGGGPNFSKTASDAITDSNVQTYFGTSADEILYEDNKVIGATATDKHGKQYSITADVVIMATGGYGNNSDLLSEELQQVLYYGPQAATGDGIVLTTTEAINADTHLMDQGKIYPNGIEVASGFAKSTVMGNNAAFTENAILVDTTGERVVNEKASYADVTEVLLGLEDQKMFILMNQASFDLFQDGIKVGGISDSEVSQWLEVNGAEEPQFIHGETLAEVAEIAGIDSAILEATVEEYNQFVENGEDTEFGRPTDFLTSKLDEGPYYLVEQKPRFATTLGGLVVDNSLQVLDKEGNLIDGLFAAGEIVGGVMGSDSPPGANNGWALTSGKVVAETIDSLLGNE